MAYKVTQSKEESLEQLKVLISAFEREYAIYKTTQYSEAQLRIDFLNPLLKTFGWDVDNEQGKSQFLREVIQEESIDVEEEDVVTKKTLIILYEFKALENFSLRQRRYLSI